MSENIKKEVYDQVLELLVMSRFMEIDIPKKADDYTSQRLRAAEYYRGYGEPSRYQNIFRMKIEKELAAINGILAPYLDELEQLKELVKILEEKGKVSVIK